MTRCRCREEPLAAIVAIILILIIGLGACTCSGFGRSLLATPTATPTKTPRPTATAMATATPTVTPTPTVDIWELNLFPDYDQVNGLLAELYGNVTIVDLALEPDASLFVVFVTGERELLVAEIAVVDGNWIVLRVYPGEKQTPTPAFPGTRES